MSVDSGNYEFGLLLETDDEDAAKRDAEDLCSALGIQGKICSVTKVVIQ